MQHTNVPTATVVIEPSHGWRSLGLRDLWEYRDLLYFLFWRDLNGRYRQMALGPLWIVLRPVFSMLVFSVVFGGLAKLPSDGLPYPIFSYAAVLPWTFFSTAVTAASASLVGNMHLISKVYFPRMIMPLSSVLTGIVDLGVSFLVLVVMMLLFGIVPTLAVLTLPFFVLLAIAMALAIGLWLASLSVVFRDVSFAVGFMLTAWQYFSPVVYSSSLVPERWQFLYHLNPMANVVDGFRWALLSSAPPPLVPMLLSTALVVVALVSGAYYFRRTERTIVDLL